MLMYERRRYLGPACDDPIPYGLAKPLPRQPDHDGSSAICLVNKGMCLCDKPFQEAPKLRLTSDEVGCVSDTHLDQRASGVRSRAAECQAPRHISHITKHYTSTRTPYRHYDQLTYNVSSKLLNNARAHNKYTSR